jgi:hypothetical protein
MTIKSTLAFGAAAAAATMMLGGAAWAAGDTQAAWEGYATNTSTQSAACSTVGGTGKGDTHVSIFRPHITAGDTPTFLSMVHLRAAITFENKNETTNPQMTGNGGYTAFGINSRAKGFSYTSAGSTFSNIVVSPNPVQASTPVITITGTLNNYFNATGCSVTFKGVYVKRID